MTTGIEPGSPAGVDGNTQETYDVVPVAGPIGATTLTRSTVERAKLMLAEASAVDVVKDIRDKAEALRQYMKQAGDGLQAQNYAAEIKLRAERRGGELLQELADASKPNPNGLNQYAAVQSHDVIEPDVTPYRAALTDNNINHMTANRWQAIASIPEDQFDEVISKTLASEEYAELTTNLMLRRAKDIRRRAQAETPPMPSDKYRVIYADPPWWYGNTMPDGTTSPADYYPAMHTMDICALPVFGMAEDNAVLFLWTTSPHLEESFQVVNAWGFQYKTSFVWDKVAHNMGHYNSVRHELLLVCTRGSCQPDVHKLFDSVQSIERTEHSRKPEQFRIIIDTIYPSGKRVELFSRTTADGWDAWGNEVPS